MANLQAQLDAIRTRQQEIEAAIKAVQEELKWAETQPPLHQPYIAFRGVVDLRSLKGPPQTLQQLLRDRLKSLQQLLKELPRQAAALRQAHAEQVANQAHGDFRSEARKLLQESQKDGHFNDAKLAKLIEEGERALRRLITVLDANPTAANARAVLNALSELMQFGGGGGTVSDDAFRSLSNATKKVCDRAERSFRQNPSSANLKDLLEARVRAQHFGGVANAKPDGWRAANKSHTTQPGDTLSGLSQRYYGTPKYWDVIYLENLAIKDPDRLPPGVPLKIP
jgi:nucleoid-associated protein YgaU